MLLLFRSFKQVKKKRNELMKGEKELPVQMWRVEVRPQNLFSIQTFVNKNSQSAQNQSYVFLKV